MGAGIVRQRQLRVRGGDSTCSSENPVRARRDDLHQGEPSAGSPQRDLPQRHVGDWYLDGGVLHWAGVRVRG